ncbi:hypothetical protein FEDK69T_28060 [Flavobacterium enshiense DK69]|uniref:Lipoprotein n=1 Tax=Flavobacterium enshiense DK69 TaxID=1107311 RepID=V6S0U8_9FLAO|nr:DUF6452 family protein [Flavobacterium enshiense]ESU20293.1 hypothetical protein FEDK69T_28060 [Flavobacterium enshiense DK69]KGO95895.1 hypothetical protein Q767_09445 [Flavobacterium enshiense DK69]
MKRLTIIAMSLLLANSFWSCEKDDICPEGTPTTPNLVIEFYDAANPETLKPVTNLGVVASGFSTGFPYNGVSKITVPLKTNEDQTILQFIQNGSDTNPNNDNIDVLTFNYSRNDIYVSRACGYKTVFQLTEDPILTDDSSLWILSRFVTQPNIQNENETHIKIYF